MEFGNDVNWSPENFIFNRIHQDPYHIVNLVTLVKKQYVYRMRCLKQKLIMNKLKLVQQIELYIA